MMSSREKKKVLDQKLRKRVSLELNKQSAISTLLSLNRHQSNEFTGKVVSLEQASALPLKPSTPLPIAAKHMLSMGASCILVVEDSKILGIVTDTDISRKGLVSGRDIQNVVLSDIMTSNPITVHPLTDAENALSLMVSKKFRHLPVVEENGTCVGILDIISLLQTSLDGLDSSFNDGVTDALDNALHNVKQDNMKKYLDAVRKRCCVPSMREVLDKKYANLTQIEIPTVSLRDSVVVAVQKMRLYNSTAVLVTSQPTSGFFNKSYLKGILTTKDIISRVLATGLNPETTSIVRIMTPDPDKLKTNSTVKDVLTLMRERKYLHMPVEDEESNTIQGLVDVLELTHFVLDRLNGMSSIEEMGVLSNLGLIDTVIPSDSASNNASPVPKTARSMLSETDSQVLNVLSFKFSTPAGNVRVKADRLMMLQKIIHSKIGTDKFQIYYEDEDNDEVVMESEDDFESARTLAVLMKWSSIKLMVKIDDEQLYPRHQYFKRLELPLVAIASAVVAVIAFNLFINK
eukprot:NODE_620_length_5922_cov_0.203160.p1 type:complete len:517 gc:universal NODE_620_length_5922_cov_0.203160:2233-3783(+)